MSNRASSSERDERGRLLPGHKKLGGRRPWQPPKNLSLADAESLRDMYERLVQQWDRGKLTPSAARTGLELVKLRATIVTAEDTERRLAAIEEKLGRGGEDE
jgi:hypothetical protein